MKQTFEEYLQDKFMEQFTGTKDQCEVAEENWFERLDVSELIEYGDDFVKQKKEIKVEDHLEYDPATPERRAFVNGFNKAISLL